MLVLLSLYQQLQIQTTHTYINGSGCVPLILHLQRQEDYGWSTSGLSHYYEHMFFMVLQVTGTLTLPEKESSALRKCKSVHIFWLASNHITFSTLKQCSGPTRNHPRWKICDQPAYLCGHVEQGTYLVREEHQTESQLHRESDNVQVAQIKNNLFLSIHVLYV